MIVVKESVLSMKEKTTQLWFSYFQISEQFISLSQQYVVVRKYATFL